MSVDPAAYPSLSVRDVGVLVGVKDETIRRLVRRGELRGYKVAGRLRFRQDDVDALAYGQPVIPNEREAAPSPPRRRRARPPARGSLAALDAIEREEASTA